MSERWKVVIIGGGFGGLYAAQHLNSDLVDVMPIDRRNNHLSQPLLYKSRRARFLRERSPPYFAAF